MKLRLVPWLTDSSIKFLNNLFKWYPSIVDEKISVLEFGGGEFNIIFSSKRL
jgi:hypothetical protein